MGVNLSADQGRAYHLAMEVIPGILELPPLDLQLQATLRGTELLLYLSTGADIDFHASDLPTSKCCEHTDVEEKSKAITSRMDFMW